jgi:hypothetical protein
MGNCKSSPIIEEIEKIELIHRQSTNFSDDVDVVNNLSEYPFIMIYKKQF